MPLVDMKDMLQHAHDHGYAVGAFDLLSLDFLQGIMAAAERARAPVILCLSEAHFDDIDFELMMPAVETAAGRASVPVAIQLNHGAGLDSAVRAINRGCNGVGIDVSHRSPLDPVATVREIVAMAHACGVPVEGELGYVLEDGDAGRHSGKIADTTVAEIQAYVEKTGVDFLAVSVGCVKGKPQLDWQRLKQIDEALAIPLVIQGGSGFSDDRFRRLIGSGVAKINCDTALAEVAGASVHNAAKSRHGSGYTALLASVREAVATEAENSMRLWGSAGRAADVSSCCRSWMPVEHLIIYNVEGLDEAGVERMMAEGRRVLGAIPGVREVVTGKAVQEKAKYRYTWLVRFCHPAVIDSYREHPDHLAFADELFRPVAGKQRISIDYQTVETVFSIQNHQHIASDAAR